MNKEVTLNMSVPCSSSQQEIILSRLPQKSQIYHVVFERVKHKHLLHDTQYLVTYFYNNFFS